MSLWYFHSGSDILYFKMRLFHGSTCWFYSFLLLNSIKLVSRFIQTMRVSMFYEWSTIPIRKCILTVVCLCVGITKYSRGTSSLLDDYIFITWQTKYQKWIYGCLFITNYSSCRCRWLVKCLIKQLSKYYSNF